MTQQQIHPTDTVLGNFQLGKLPDPEHADIESHLAECSDCQGRVAAIRIDDSLIGLLAGCAAPNPGLDSAATPPAAAETQGWDKAAATVTDDEAVPNSLAGHAKYQAVRRLGVGGMGTVWLAQHALMNRPVAVKVIRPELLARAGATVRFLREVRAAARLHHPNIVTAFDAEPVGTSCLLVMEYVDGETLADRVKEGPLPVVEACQAAHDAARGLAHAHAAGLVHRDVKPHNLIRAADGTTKVLDFGLAGVGVGELAAAGEDNVTGAGMVFGTPDYIAPEQADDPHGADARADVYGLGCTLYHLLSGRPPFPDESILQKINAHHLRQPAPIPNLPPRLSEVLARMMAKNVEDRFQTATEAADALEPFTGRAAAKPRRRWLVAVLLFALVVLLAAAGVVYTIQRGRQEIVIKTDDPDIEVVMRRNGEVLRVRDPKSGQTWELDTLKNEVGLAEQTEGLRFELGSDPFILRRQGKEVFRIERLPKPVVQEKQKIGEIRSFGDEKHRIVRIAVSSNGKRVLTAGTEGAARYWNVDTGKEIYNFPHAGRVFAVAITPDDEKLLTCGAEFLVHVWDVATGKEVRQLRGHTGSVTGVAVSPAGRWVATASWDRTVRLWELETGVNVATFTGHTQIVLGVTFSPDGTRIASWGGDKTVRVWDIRERKEILCCEGHTEAVKAATFTPDGGQLLSGSLEGTAGSVKLWNLATGKATFTSSALGAVNGLAISPDSRRALIAGTGGLLRLWDLVGGHELAALPGHDPERGIGDVVFLPDGRTALSGGLDGTIRLWRVSDSSALPTRSFAPPPEKTGIVQQLRLGSQMVFTQVAPDGRTFLSSYHWAEVVEIYETGTGRRVHLFPGWVGVYADQGRKIVTLLANSGDNLGRVYDLATGKLERTFGKFAGNTWCLFSIAGGNQVITWDDANNVQVFDISTGVELLTWRYDRVNVDFTFTPDGRRLLFRPFGDTRYSVCDTATGKRVEEFAELRGLSRLRHFSADGKTIQVGDGSGPNSCTVHRVSDGKMLRRSERVPDDARWQGCSPDRTKQAFILPDGTIQLRDSVTFKLLNSVRIDLPGDYKRFRAPHNQAVTDDGRFAILNTRDQDGHVIVIRFPDPPKP